MTNLFDELRATQFPQLRDGIVYADWTGSALPPIYLIDEWHQHARATLLGNPHSCHRPSATALTEIDETREAILRYFNASPDEYDVIFTSGATAAIRLLEHYKFEGGEILLTADNHNSVNGLRETAKRNGATVKYSPIKDDLTLDASVLEQALSRPGPDRHRLFAYPAKSNHAGTVHSLDWVARAKEKGWDVLLDAAAYAANDRLDLSKIKPDFVPISFYKLFGFPTGVGCLIIRKKAYDALHKKWFAGGSILYVSIAKDIFVPESPGPARFEDGTVNFAHIPAIKTGLKFMERLGDTKTHAVALATAFYDELTQMCEGRSSIIIHSARGNDVVTFSVRAGEEILDAWIFERAANEQGVYVRTGCFCNPGVNEKIFGYTTDTIGSLHMGATALSSEGMTTEGLKRFSGGKPIGAIRASFGYANNMADVRRLVEVTRDILRDL